MSKRANGLQRMAAQVSDGPLGGCAEGLAATEFSAAAIDTGSIAGRRSMRTGSGISGLVYLNR